MSITRVRITPTPGFVIKTSTTTPGCLSPSSPIPPLAKVFINVLFHTAIPPPPAARLGPDAEQRLLAHTMHGALGAPDAPWRPDQSYIVPVVVGDGVQAKDKAGNPCIVFDATLHPSLKPRLLRDMDFKSFVLEIILSQIESPTHAQHPPTRSLSLSRTLATPNMRYKGTLQARDVEVPDLQDVGVQPLADDTPGVQTQRRPLIEELPDPRAEQAHNQQASRPAAPRQLKSILKKPEVVAEASVSPVDPHVLTADDAAREVPEWRWEEEGGRKMVIEVPKWTRPHHAHAALSVSQDMVTLRTPVYVLQVTLDASTKKNPLDIEKARAEWRVGEGRMVVYL